MPESQTPSELDRENIELIEELHRRQGVMYAGGPIEPVTELLAPQIVWHVPGNSPIAGEHRGLPAVVGYFERRRKLARHTLRLEPGPIIAQHDVVVQLVDGRLQTEHEQLRWSTVGVYRVDQRRVSEVWLLALELDAFDRIWGEGLQQQ